MCPHLYDFAVRACPRVWAQPFEIVVYTGTQKDPLNQRSFQEYLENCKTYTLMAFADSGTRDHTRQAGGVDVKLIGPFGPLVLGGRLKV